MNNITQSNYTQTVTPEVHAIGKMHLEGNITPHAWYEKIRFENGKVDLVSITLLSEILYWYRPTYVRDEYTGQVTGIHKKFKGDALQKNKRALAEQFGLTERQVKDSLLRLEQMGLITRDYRTVIAEDGTKLGNILFIKIHPEKIEEITFIERHPYDVSTSEGRRFNVTPMTFQRQTNTKTTTKTTTNNKNTYAPPNGGASLPSFADSSKPPKEEQPPPKTKDDPPKIPRADGVSTTDAEHAKLVEKFGCALTQEGYEDLSEWKKSASPAQVKKHNSDYRRLRKWVIPDLIKSQQSHTKGKTHETNLQSARRAADERWIKSNGNPNESSSILRF